MLATPQVCREPGCGSASVQGKRYCEAHQKDNARIRRRQQYDKYEKPSWHRWYDLACWRRIRAYVLAKFPICAKCGREAATDVDHIVPHRGRWLLFVDVKNCQGLCARCHSQKTASEDGGFGNDAVT